MENSTSYLNSIHGKPSLTIDGIVSICKELLPAPYNKRPWTHPELSNGISLLKSEDGMNAYLASYGEMHYTKCRAAFQNFPFDELIGTIEIVDWGCGQGIGSLCAVEVLDQHDKYPYLRKVTLIEPSPHTLERAKANISCFTKGSVMVETINRYLPGKNEDMTLEGLSYTCTNVIHIFSNILDITTIDLAEVARMASASGHQHYVLCMGPVNNYSFRIDQFCGIFGNQYFFSDIKDTQYGRTKDTFHSFTCKTKCFHYDGKPLVLANAANYVPSSFVANAPVLSEYDPQLSVANGVISEKTSQIYSILNRLLSDNDIILLAPDIKGDKPHIVIVRPNIGILIIQLFEKDLNNYHFRVIKEADVQKGVEAEYDYKNLVNLKQEHVCSPLDTVDTYQKNIAKEHLKGLYEDIFSDRRNWSVIRKMVVFTENTTQDAEKFFLGHWDYTKIIGSDFFVDLPKQDSLFETMKFDRPNSLFNDAVFKRFMLIISPHWHSFKEGKVINATTPQKILSKSNTGARQKISGVAGSGKTFVLARRAVNAQVRTGRDVLVLTFNIALTTYMRKRIGEIRADFSWDKIHINYYHQFFRANARLCGLHVGFNSYMDVTFFDGYQGTLPKYSAIFVDEVQDYQTTWLQILMKHFLAEDGEFVVFGDPKQNIYHRPVDKNGDVKLGVISGTWNHDLKDGKRFSVPQFAKLAMDFQKMFFTTLPTDNFQNAGLVQGSLLSSLKYANIGKTEDMCKMANYCINILKKFGINKEEAVVLAQTGDILREIDFQYRNISKESTTTTIVSLEEHSKMEARGKNTSNKGRVVNGWFKLDKDDMEHYRKATFTMDDSNLKVSTIHSFKGWEAEAVILFLQAETPDKEKFCLRPGEDNPELIYAAITRAKTALFIINLGNAKYDRFFNQFK